MKLKVFSDTSAHTLETEFSDFFLRHPSILILDKKIIETAEHREFGDIKRTIYIFYQEADNLWKRKIILFI